MSTYMPGFQSFFLGCLHHFVFDKLATNSLGVKHYCVRHFHQRHTGQVLSQALESRSSKLTIVTFMDVLFFKGDHCT